MKLPWHLLELSNDSAGTMESLTYCTNRTSPQLFEFLITLCFVNMEAVVIYNLITVPSETIGTARPIPFVFAVD